VKLLSLLSAFLLISALAGLVAGPFAQSWAAAPKPMPSSMKMADAMPCCPDEDPASDCQKSCPLMAMCANQTLFDAAGWQQLRVPMQPIAVTRPPSDAPLAGIDSLPPPRPPKSIV
jgi:hypothetical protein